MAVYLSPESVDYHFRELEKLEGHQVVLPVEPGSTISEDKWLLYFSAILLSTSVDADEVVVRLVLVFPDLTSVLRWLEVELVNGIVG